MIPGGKTAHKNGNAADGGGDSLLTGAAGGRVSSIYAAAVIVLALVLRIYHLGTESLWSDEGCSLRDAYEWSPFATPRPLYYLILKGWIGLGLDNNEFQLRLPAVLFGVASVWVLFALGRLIVGNRAALMASVFMAISALHVNHAQEVRMYSLVTLTVLLSTYFMVLMLNTGRARYAVAYTVISFLGLTAFPLTILALATHGLFLLLYMRAYRPKNLMILGGEVVLAVTWLPWFLMNARMAEGFGQGWIGIADRPTIAGMFKVFGQFFLWKWSDDQSKAGMIAFAFSLFVLAAALYGSHGLRRADAGLMLAWLSVIVPVAGLAILSHSVANMWMVRYVIFAAPLFYLLVSRGILSIRNKWIAGAAALGVVMFTLARLGMYYANPVRPEWRPAVHYIMAHEQPGDVIGIYSAGNFLVFRHYYQGRCNWSPMGENLTPQEEFGEWNDARVQKLLREYPYKGKRMWLALSKHTFRGGFRIIGYVEKTYRVLDRRDFKMIELYLLDASGKPIPLESP